MHKMKRTLRFLWMSIFTQNQPFQLIIFPQYVLKKFSNLSRANVQMCISLEIGLLKNLVISYKIVTVKPKMKQLI